MFCLHHSNSFTFDSLLQRKQQRRLTAKSLRKLKCPSTQQISIQAKLVTGVNFSVERSIQWRYITLDSLNGRTEHSETRSKWMVMWATHFDNIVWNKGLWEGLSSPPDSTLPYPTLHYSTARYSTLIEKVVLYGGSPGCRGLETKLFLDHFLGHICLCYCTILYPMLSYSSLLHVTLLYSTLLASTLFYSTLL